MIAPGRARVPRAAAGLQARRCAGGTPALLAHVLFLAVFFAQSAAACDGDLQELMRILRTGTEEERSVAADRIVCFRDDAEPAVPLMIALFDAENGEIQANAIDAVAKIGPAAVPHLMRALDSKNVNTRRNACGTLGRMGSIAKPALPALARLAVGSPDTAANAEIAMRKILCGQ